MIGKRVYPREDGWLDPNEINSPGCYGRATNPKSIGHSVGWWEITAPDGSCGSLNPDIHKVIEHDDGTITVTPSIDFSKRRPNGWHGFLTNGEFKSI